MLNEAKIPYIYNFSPSVVPPPSDWADWIIVAGYFFLDTPGTKELDPGLMEFIKRARVDGKKIVYVGFGSIVVPDPIGMTKAVIAAGAGQSSSSLSSHRISDVVYRSCRCSSHLDERMERPNEQIYRSRRHSTGGILRRLGPS